MRECKCGAALDYAPAGVTRCYGCRQTAPAAVKSAKDACIETARRIVALSATGPKVAGYHGANWSGMSEADALAFICNLYKSDQITTSEFDMAVRAHANGLDYVSFSNRYVFITSDTECSVLGDGSLAFTYTGSPPLQTDDYIFRETPAVSLDRIQRWYDDGAITKEQFLAWLDMPPVEDPSFLREPADDVFQVTYRYYDLVCDAPKYNYVIKL